MPEGDTVFRLAARLEKALSGAGVLASEFRVPELATRDLSGRTLLGHDTYGKHLLTRFSGGVTLHSHLRMDGQWTLTEGNTRLPARLMPRVRLILQMSNGRTAWGIQLHSLRLVATDREDQLVGHLGPDPLHPKWDRDAAIQRLVARGERPLVSALLDQRLIAGLGNMWVNELAFMAGHSPWTPVADVDLGSLVDRAARALQRSAAGPANTYQVTTGSAFRGQKHWVYGRTALPCLRCGTVIRTVSERTNDPGNRRTWWCPSCQPGPGPEARQVSEVR